MKKRLELTYTLGEGWLAPWIAALRQGVALASTCGPCGTVQFPPLRACPDCRRPADGWEALPGTATVLFRTAGADGDFALARFDGADSCAVLRSDTLPKGATRGLLRPCPDGPPTLSLDPEPKA